MFFILLVFVKNGGFLHLEVSRLIIHKQFRKYLHYFVAYFVPEFWIFYQSYDE